MSDWNKIYPRTLKFEGKFTNNPNDNGNWTGGKKGIGELRGTKFGISAASYPNCDIANLTENQAIKIYEEDYFKKLKLDRIISNRIAWKLFDIAVNMGTGTAARLAQISVGAVVDGIIGEQTLAKINNSPEPKILQDLANEQRDKYLRIVEGDQSQKQFLNGWLARAADIGNGLV